MLIFQKKKLIQIFIVLEKVVNIKFDPIVKCYCSFRMRKGSIFKAFLKRFLESFPGTQKRHYKSKNQG